MGEPGSTPYLGILHCCYLDEASLSADATDRYATTRPGRACEATPGFSRSQQPEANRKLQRCRSLSLV